MADGDGATRRRPVIDGEIRLLVAPANFAGQGTAWASAARRVPGVRACSFAVANGAGLTTAADYVVPREVFEDPAWAAEHEAWVTGFTHVLIEAGRPVTGTVRGLDAWADNEALLAAGVCVGMVAHGSDVRRPDRHAAREQDSPFAVLDRRTVAVRQKYADRIAPLIDSCRWSFVSTPDLVDDVPTATWLPVGVDVARWQAPEWRPLRDGRRPRVVHVPSHSLLKGTERIEPTLFRLAEAGRLDYAPLRDIPQERMPAVIAEADVVLDQFALGSYGVAAVEAMAAGRLVVGHVRPEVRARVKAATGRDLPILQARAAELEDVLGQLFSDHDAWAEQAARGPLFVDDVHDGRLASRVLADYLKLGPAEADIAAQAREP